MCRVGYLGRILVVTCVCGMVTAASASAHEFLASKTGTGSLSATTVQVFTTSAGQVQCKKASQPVEISALKNEILDSKKLAFSECEAFGLSATSFTMSLEWNANGHFTLAEPVTIEAGFGLCTIKLEVSSNLEHMTYKNLAGGKLGIETSVTGLTSSGEGICAYAKESNGKYTGSFKEELPGGTLEFK